MTRRFLVLFSLLGSCDDPEVRPEVVVTIDSGAAVRGAADHLRIRVFGGSASARLPSEPRADFEIPETDADGARAHLAFPLSFSLVPEDLDPSRTYRVVVEALDASGAPVATTRLIGSYRQDRVLAFVESFEDACVAVTCADETTCRAGECVSARIPVDELAAHCEPGSASFAQRCVATSTCAGASPCAAHAVCGARPDGFLCSCEDGFAGDPESLCEPIVGPSTPMCEALSAPTNGSVSPASGVASTVASYRCDADYELVGNSDLRTRTCQSTLVWSGTAPVCEPSGGFPGWPVPGPSHPRTYLVSEDEGLVLDSNSGLEWQRDMNPGAMSYAAAVGYCESLEIEGKSDFRVPSRIELLSIVDYGGGVPAIDSAVFPGTRTSVHTWTRTARLAAPTNGRWTVGFEHGDTYGALESMTLFVRCVR